MHFGQIPTFQANTEVCMVYTEDILAVGQCQLLED